MQTYELLDAGDGKRLEQWGPYRIIRPDPSASWLPLPLPEWQQVDAVFRGTTVNNGSWETFRALPETWTVELGSWKFAVGLSASKHLGLFPEQFEQWQLLHSLISQHKTNFAEPIKFLNLFAYTGAASIAATTAGAFTTHVDSSSPAIGRAKENQILNNLDERSIRWIREDVLTFVQREVRRGHHYDIIALDPPAYGHGTKGERFRFDKEFVLLLTEVKKLLSAKPLAVFVTTYSNELQPTELASQCQKVFSTAAVTAKLLSLIVQSTKQKLTTGSWACVQLN